ncbi:orf3 [Faba bean necrotic yellows C1 alphasatellite]|uniref:Orf3 protein n=1 Tax=Faba bean necrotic yellows C1 alphasatellite TaxID=1453080 RepID=Q66864_FBNC1|nr:orf3 [Faba bean necrotic yellows C1 alphasatellite]CAA56849.1 orf3 [Faba bean necrotic yellows C1 alphasatellite]
MPRWQKQLNEHFYYNKDLQIYISYLQSIYSSSSPSLDSSSFRMNIWVHQMQYFSLDLEHTYTVCPGSFLRQCKTIHT